MKPKVYENISSFEVWPKKTFLGLDKSKAHCFTLPKQLTEAVIMTFGLRPGYLQHNIIFVIDGLDYKATARMVVMDRSKPNKLEKEEQMVQELDFRLRFKMTVATLRQVAFILTPMCMFQTITLQLVLF